MLFCSNERPERDVTRPAVYNYSVIVGGLLALFAALFSERVCSFQWAGYFETVIERLVPCVEIVSRISTQPCEIGFIWSVSWMMAPVYFCTLFVAVPPWGSGLRQVILEKIRGPGGFKSFLILIGLGLLSFYVAASDFGAIDGVSFYRGSMFDVENRQTGFAAVPFSSFWASVLSSWFWSSVPAAEYWFLAMIVSNVRVMLKTFAQAK